MADVVTIPADRFALLTEEERLGLAQEIERVVAMRVLRSLAGQAAQANAGYRFMDTVGRWAGTVALGLLVVAALYLAVAEAALRVLAALAGLAFEGAAVCLFWAGLVAVCAAYLYATMRWLYRRSHGRSSVRAALAMAARGRPGQGKRPERAR